MRKYDLFVTNQKDLVSVMGLFGSFQALRDGSYELRRLGVDGRDFSVLFTEDAVTPSDDTKNMSGLGLSHGEHNRRLIGGTFESLSYLGALEQGIVAGAITSLGVPQSEAEEYEVGICRGWLLLCVRSNSSALADLAMEVFLHAGAECIVAVPQQHSFTNTKDHKNQIWFEPVSSCETRLIC